MKSGCGEAKHILALGPVVNLTESNLTRVIDHKFLNWEGHGGRHAPRI